MFSEQSDVKSQKAEIEKVSSSLDILLQRIRDSQHFDCLVTEKRLEFENSLRGFNPDVMNDGQKIVLRPLKKGFNDFVTHLRNAYVSRYSRQTIDWQKPKQTPTSTTSSTGAPKSVPLPASAATTVSVQQEKEPSEDAMKCAKICATIIPIIESRLTNMRKRRHNTGWRTKKCFGNLDGSLPAFLADCDYSVCAVGDKQDGEVRRDLNGSSIYELLETEVNGQTLFNKNNGKGYESKTLSELTGHLKTYYTTCHLTLPPSPKYPCSVFLTLVSTVKLMVIVNHCLIKMSRIRRTASSYQCLNITYPAT
ncbi:Apolipophorin-III superfamily protein, putative [Babesia ovata]|uniref:Apolipophorin-III superfamily protein, putative n=1 Tax=Babesia ovata TaxID=189622 RepID=A0A2H6KJI6_9APIC|nr:Apolipophorin-III superfamily protein, putative [Babesia ovata]GBE63148.1 Apolipophorin-III superfamily protein, putative [Babesia ovata]